MHLHFVVLFALGMLVGGSYALAESGSASVPRRISDEQNSESIKKPLQDMESSDEDSTDEDAQVMKDLEDLFTASLIRLVQGGDELYKDARFDSIIRNIKASMMTVTGEIDEDYVKKFIHTIRKVDDAKRRQLDEVTMNKLGFSKSDYQAFLDKFVKEVKSGLPAASRGSARTSGPTISE